MQLINSSYRQCIDPACRLIPTQVLRMEAWKGPNRYTIQILSCSTHLEVAQELRKSKFGALSFEHLDKPQWLKKAQEGELKSKQEKSQ